MTEIAGGGRTSLKRFYKDASVGALDGAFAILLDGRPAKTPRRAPIAAPSRPLADAIAAEWAGAGDAVRFDDLRLTRLTATAIDLGAEQAPEWRAELARFAGSDLICYRAQGPEALLRRQRDAWDPFIAWARSELGAPFVTTQGVVAVAQPELAIDAVRRAADGLDPWRLIAAKTAAEITGSAILALALERRAFAPDAIFSASRTDEAYQAEIWGADEEAERRAARLKRDFDAAARFLELLALQ
jgi:chaperone required for assembly of F1-ATPase